MKAPIPKQLLKLVGIPILIRTLQTALSNNFVTMVVVAAHQSITQSLYDLLQAHSLDLSRIAVVEGGTDRQSSVYNGTQHAAAANADVLLVHDAVRPLASAALYERVAGAAMEHGCAIPVVEVTDTIKETAADATVVSTLDRSRLRAAQTPQGFRREILMHCHHYAHEHGIGGTDDSSIAERLGYPVHTVAGEPTNIKITTEVDVAVATALLAPR